MNWGVGPFILPVGYLKPRPGQPWQALSGFLKLDNPSVGDTGVQARSSVKLGKDCAYDRALCCRAALTGDQRQQVMSNSACNGCNAKDTRTA